MNDKKGCAVPFLTCLIFWAIFFLGVCADKAAGADAAPARDERVAAAIQALVEVAAACEGQTVVNQQADVEPSTDQNNLPVDLLVDSVEVLVGANIAHTAGIDHLAGVDPNTVLAVDKPDLLDQVPELTSLGIYKITAYCACQICCNKTPDDPEYGITATGTVATQGRTIAADPAVLSYGTIVVINGHEYVVEDCGGAIDGKEIDMFFDDHQTAREWGNQWMEVFTYEEN
ncbi:MAG: 3D domain-containing protein [Lachnospiraceae bacterium]|nr:3D domain-containing protein [Lachnospiraceae bacterium]